MNYDYDLLVCGGGSAGFAAAVTAGRLGRTVCLVEMLGELGGVLTAGNVQYVMDASSGDGLLGEVWQLSTVVYEKNFMFDGEAMKLWMEEELEKAGVEPRYFTKVSAVETCGDSIAAVTLEDKLGRTTVTAKAYLDCTGDGDLAYMAGAGFDFGNEDGTAQPMSFECTVGGIQLEEVKDYVGNYGGYQATAHENLLALLRSAGVEPTYLRPLLHHIRDDIFVFNINHQYLSGLSPAEVTRATIEGRRESWKAVETLRSLGGVWKNLSILKTPVRIGAREGRRIHGKYTVTVEDLISGRRWENPACHVTFNVDIHNKQGYEDGNLTVLPYDVPMEALMSRDFENLYMAGRCISGDFYAHGSYRVSGNTFVMGESLGRYLAKRLK